MSAITESANVVGEPLVGDEVDRMIAALSRATPGQIAALRAFFPDEGSNMVASAIVSVPPEKSVKVAKPAAPKPKVAKPAAPAPPPAGADGAPVAADYRVSPASINDSVCIGRRIKGGEDKRWKPAVYRESQCGAAIAEGSDLCTKCQARSEKYDAESTPKADWTGRITEEPLEWVHMLGTPWALAKKPVFQGSSSAAPSPSEAVSSSSSSASAPPTKKALAAAASAEKKAAKAKEAEEKKAAKEAEKAEKAAAKAAKPKPAPKAKKETKAAGGAGGPPPPAEAAAAEEEAEEVEVALKLIDGTLYSVKDGNVYEFDEMAEKVGDYVGRLKDGEIDTEAEEVTAEEADD